jgi:hypothetical protein
MAGGKIQTPFELDIGHAQIGEAFRILRTPNRSSRTWMAEDEIQEIDLSLLLLIICFKD